MTKDRFRLHSAARYFSCRFVAFLAAGVVAAPIAFAMETTCSRPVTDAMPLIEKMERSWGEVSDYTSTLLKTERFIDGTVTEERGHVEFRKPDQIYLHVLEGANAGAELLFPKPGTNSVILGRPGGVSGAVAGFLVNVPAIGRLIPHEFDLDDGRLMDGQHHPLPDVTIAGMIDLISVNLRTAAWRLEGSMCFHASDFVDGDRAIKLEVLFPFEEGMWHVVAKGETLWTISEYYGQDRYVIQYNNPSLHPAKALPAGARIFVPRYYAARAFIWVSESSHLPVKLHMYDAEGRLYEAYSNIDLRLDVGLTAEDFDPVRYGFPALTTAGEKASEGDSSTR
jgi:outer membrane lipoprotein-sorting protein